MSCDVKADDRVLKVACSVRLFGSECEATSSIGRSVVKMVANTLGLYCMIVNVRQSRSLVGVWLEWLPTLWDYLIVSVLQP